MQINENHVKNVAGEVIKTIHALPIPQEVKTALTDLKLIDSQQNLFMCFAQAFMSAFPGIDSATQNLINTITYLGARGIYEADRVYDVQISGREIQKPLMFSHFYHSEAQRLLSSLFPSHHAFWSQYYQRYWLHFSELEESYNTNTKLNFNAYCRLLHCKYAMLYVPVDMMHFLTDQRHLDSYQSIIQSLKWFTVGYNIPNEIRGLKTDLETHINNYAWWRLKEKLSEFNIDPEDHSPEELNKLVYVTGLAEKMLEESLEAFDKAIEKVQPLELPIYEYVVRKRVESNKMEMEILQEHLSSIF